MKLDRVQEKRKSDFLGELKELMGSYCVEFNITDDGKIYGMHSPVLEIQFNTTYNSNGRDIECNYFDIEYQ